MGNGIVRRLIKLGQAAVLYDRDRKAVTALAAEGPTEAVPAAVLSAALYGRFRSSQKPAFADKILSAMRKGFGVHIEPKVGRA
jgi:6-phosphogluconate dehydrogenase (decarboxylating)